MGARCLGGDRKPARAAAALGAEGLGLAAFLGVVFGAVVNAFVPLGVAAPAAGFEASVGTGPREGPRYGPSFATAFWVADFNAGRTGVTARASRSQPQPWAQVSLLASLLGLTALAAPRLL